MLCSRSSRTSQKPEAPCKPHSLEASLEASLEGLRNGVASSVASLDRVPADPQQLAKHKHAIAQRMNPRPFAMRPGDRNLPHHEPEFPGEIEQFRIESPSLNLLQRKYRLRAAPSKRFKPALRILELQT